MIPLMPPFFKCERQICPKEPYFPIAKASAGAIDKIFTR